MINIVASTVQHSMLVLLALSLHVPLAIEFRGVVVATIASAIEVAARVVVVAVVFVVAAAAAAAVAAAVVVVLFNYWVVLSGYCMYLPARECPKHTVCRYHIHSGPQPKVRYMSLLSAVPSW